MKVYFHYTEGTDEALHLTQKVTLPKSWVERHPLLKAQQLFLDAYNKKKGTSLSAEETHLTLDDGTILYPDDPLSGLSSRADLYLRHGRCPERPEEPPAAPDETSENAPPENDGLIRCRNLGCKAWFREDDNADDACSYHLGPAIFHDRGKGWACCKDTHRLVYSWEEFERIPGCQKGPHSKSPQKNSTAVAESPTVQAARRVQEREEQAPLKTAADFNRENPNAATAVSAAVAAAKRPKCTRKEDGTAKCVRKGCQSTFRLRDNGPTECRYHSGEPVFWDTSKYWSCCPNKVKYDFDAFLAVPGCQTGYHDDASGDFDNEEVAAATVAAFQEVQ